MEVDTRLQGQVCLHEGFANIGGVTRASVNHQPVLRMVRGYSFDHAREEGTELGEPMRRPGARTKVLRSGKGQGDRLRMAKC